MPRLSLFLFCISVTIPLHYIEYLAWRQWRDSLWVQLLYYFSVLLIFCSSIVDSIFIVTQLRHAVDLTALHFALPNNTVSLLQPMRGDNVVLFWQWISRWYTKQCNNSDNALWWSSSSFHSNISRWEWKLVFSKYCIQKAHEFAANCNSSRVTDTKKAVLQLQQSDMDKTSPTSHTNRENANK